MSTKKPIRYSLLFLIVATISLVYCIKKSSHEIVFSRQIPKEDRAFLERQFQQLFTNEFGYTLVGIKPVSLEEYSNIELIRNPDLKIKFIQYLDKLFKNSKDFVFITIYYESDSYNCTSYLINKKALTRVLKNETALVPANCSIEELLENKELLATFIRGDSSVLSILLGYGRGNGYFYKRRNNIGYYLKKQPFVKLTPLSYDQYGLCTAMFERRFRNIIQSDVPYSVKAPLVSPGFSSLEEEWQWIQRMKIPVNDFEIPFLFSTPAFISKKGPETRAIMKSYAQGAKKLGKMFANKGYIEAVVEEVNKADR